MDKRIGWYSITFLPHPLITQPIYAWLSPALCQWNKQIWYPRLFSLHSCWCAKLFRGACCPMKLGPILFLKFGRLKMIDLAKHFQESDYEKTNSLTGWLKVNILFCWLCWERKRLQESQMLLWSHICCQSLYWLQAGSVWERVRICTVYRLKLHRSVKVNEQAKFALKSTIKRKALVFAFHEQFLGGLSARRNNYCIFWMNDITCVAIG